MAQEGRERALVEIERRIVEGELAPGAALDEARLAAELDADAVAVREALARLERDGFVCAGADDAYAVAPLSESELREAYPIALLLEGMAVRATTYSPAILDRLRAINDAMAVAGADLSAAAHRDFDFHDELCSHCANEQLLATLRPLKRLLLRYEHRYMSSPEAVRASVTQHEVIVDVLARDDREAAARAVEENFRRSLADAIDRL